MVGIIRSFNGLYFQYMINTEIRLYYNVFYIITILIKPIQRILTEPKAIYLT